MAKITTTKATNEFWKSELVKIKGVPTFMFFDPEGKIISVKMTRPSNEKTRETFNSYKDL